MWWTMPALLRLSITRPKGAAIRGLGTRAITVGPSLGAMTVVIGPAIGSSRIDFSKVSLVDQFTQLCQHLRLFSPV